MIETRIQERADYSEILKMIEEGSRVLDLGCGNGDLLKDLRDKKNIIGRGIEIDSKSIFSCVQKGLSVLQVDIDEGLADFQDQTYDYVILSKTLQVVRRPRYVIKEMLRVGKKGIVSFPNIGFWKIRLQFLLKGRMPKTRLLPYEWYDTPNIHLGSIGDFSDFCEKENIKIIKKMALRKSRVLSLPITKKYSNLFADESLFVITRH